MSGGSGVPGAPVRAESDLSECVVKEEPAWEPEGALWAALGAGRDTIYAEDVSFALPDTSRPENYNFPPEGAQGSYDPAFPMYPEGSGTMNLDRIKVEHKDNSNYIDDVKVYFYECPICFKIIKTGLKCHLVTHTQKEIDNIKDVLNPSKGNFECHICSLRFIRRQSLVEHLNHFAKLDAFQQQLHRKMPRWRIVKKKYECDACGRQVSRKDHLARHLAKHELDEPVTCGHCNEPFKYGWELLDHIKLGICKENIEVTTNFKKTPEDLKLKQCFVKLERLGDIHEGKTVKSLDNSPEICSEDENLLEDDAALGTDEEMYYCGVCEEQFDTLSLLGEHQCKRPKKPFSCEICKRKFMHQCLLDTHTRIHTGEKPFSCEICKISFRIKAQLKVHNLRHTDKKPTCKICKKQFAAQNALRNHQRLHTGEKPKKPYSCKMCNKKYKSPGELETHVRTHTGEKPFACHICNKQFLRKQPFGYHLQTHMDEKYPCHLCDKQLNTTNALKKHLKVHTETKRERRYSCDVCNKRFYTKNNLVNHKRVHTGETPFVCKFCPKRFKQQAHLLTHHQRVHTDEKPFSCTVCNKQFVTNSQLTSHSRVHTGEKPHSCDLCAKTFSHITGLKEHRKFHTGEKPFACGVCKKAFARKTRMKEHMQCHSKDWGFSCDVCQRRFQKQDYLRLHMKSRHMQPDQNV